MGTNRDQHHDSGKRRVEKLRRGEMCSAVSTAQPMKPQSRLTRGREMLSLLMHPRSPSATPWLLAPHLCLPPGSESCDTHHRPPNSRPYTLARTFQPALVLLSLSHLLALVLCLLCYGMHARSRSYVASINCASRINWRHPKVAYDAHGCGHALALSRRFCTAAARLRKS